MAYNGDIKFKGTSSGAFPLIITEPPQVIHSALITEEYQIPGRDGVLYGSNPYRGSAQISVKMALKTSQTITGNVSAYKTAYRQVMQWLQGTGNLVIGDSQDSFYEVQKIEITTDQRIVLQYGELEVLFTVYPFEFLNTGNTAVSSYSSLANDGDECAPLYRITGTGSGSLTVNGHTMTFSANTGELYIDIRRKIAYNANGVNQNSVISGDYDDMRLQHGTNSISVSGGSLRVYPKWGFKI